ncbi:MAG TPA: SgcJ/EcaC family oxidoreductase [Acidimicrobiales bacterium]
MEDDEHMIRDLLDAWWRGTETKDIDAVLALMADDILFLTPGGEPFGKAEFADRTRSRTFKVEGHSDIEELEIVGNWAWMRTHISVTMTPADGQPDHRAGYTLTILRKEPDGRWVVARDANLLSA